MSRKRSTNYNTGKIRLLWKIMDSFKSIVVIDKKEEKINELIRHSRRQTPAVEGLSNNERKTRKATTMNTRREKRQRR